MVESLDRLMDDFFKQVTLKVDFNQIGTDSKQDGSL